MLGSYQIIKKLRDVMVVGILEVDEKDFDLE
jgi:hypothetical protein